VDERDSAAAHVAVPKAGKVQVSLFDPFAPFAVMSVSPAGGMQLWSEATQAMLSAWSSFGAVPVPVAAPKA
jgi:hypothetical protein